jgi:hypothetical protein
VNVTHLIGGRVNKSDHGSSCPLLYKVDEGGYFLASKIKIVQSSNENYVCQIQHAVCLNG